MKKLLNSLLGLASIGASLEALHLYSKYPKYEFALFALSALCFVLGLRFLEYRPWEGAKPQKENKTPNGC